ncbi:MAG: Calx-beta domain-containing protein, partial [Pyrinomonadaceae bacterium]
VAVSGTGIQPGTLQFSSATYSVSEGAGSVTITVTRTGGSDGAATVQYVTSDGTAEAGSDYEPLSDALIWLAGDMSNKTFNVTINEDALVEGAETFDITLNALSGAPLGTPSVATVTITDNDVAPPALSVGDVSVAEPSSGISHAVFPVTLSAVSAQTVTVNFATADGTATQPGDYTSASGTVIFAPGETSKTIAVVVKADALSDTPENFSLNLSSPSNATVADGTGVATITAPNGAGTVLISEFRLRGPSTGNAAPTDFDTPLVASPPGRKFNQPVKSTVEEGDDPTAPQPPIVNDDGGGTNAPATPEESDEFIEIYNNTDADIVVTDANPATCLLQIPTVEPTMACGWALVDLQGAVSNIPRFVIPTGTIIPARGHYLAASTGYSLSTLALPDLIYDPPAYPGAEADYTGLALFKTADRAQFTPANVFDAVGFDGVATPYREGAGLPLSGGVTEDLEHSFVRNQTSSLPSDTGDNGADFTLVATSPAQLLSGTATLGAPGPENLSSPVTRNSGFAVTIPPSVPSSVRSLTPVTNGSLGTLSLRRRFTNNTGQSLNRLRFRVVQVTTYNNKQVFPNQAEVRVLDAQLTGLGGTGLLATTVETPPAQTSGGGVNTGLVVSGSLVLAQPLAAGQSVDVEFLLGVMRGGSYQFVVVVEGAQ